jgi:hypothetical protein
MADQRSISMRIQSAVSDQTLSTGQIGTDASAAASVAEGTVSVMGEMRQMLDRIQTTLEETRRWTVALTAKSDNLIGEFDVFAARVRSV